MHLLLRVYNNVPSNLHISFDLEKAPGDHDLSAISQIAGPALLVSQLNYPISGGNSLEGGG